MAQKRRVGRYPKAFRRMAVERLKACDNIVELSQELGVHRRLLYKWRDQFAPFDPSEESPPGNSRESTLRKEINQLKRVLVDKTLELDFFKGALQKVEARRQKSGSTLFGVGATDPLTFATVVVVLALLALAACYIPVHRAMSVGHIIALRYE